MTFRLGGETVLENAVIPISYTVNTDCTGSYHQYSPMGAILRYVHRAQWRVIATIATAPPGNQVSSRSEGVTQVEQRR